MRLFFYLYVLFVSIGLFSLPVLAADNIALLTESECGIVSSELKSAWPHTDFSRCTVSIDEIRSGGPGKDGIPAIDVPHFIPAVMNL